MRNLIKQAPKFTGVVEEKLEVVELEISRIWEEIIKAKNGEESAYGFDFSILGPRVDKVVEPIENILLINGADENKVFFIKSLLVADLARNSENAEVEKMANQAIAQNFLLRNEIEDVSEIDNIVKILDFGE